MAAARKLSAIAAKCNRNGFVVTLECQRIFTRIYLPQFDGTIETGGGEAAPHRGQTSCR